MFFLLTRHYVIGGLFSSSMNIFSLFLCNFFPGYQLEYIFFFANCIICFFSDRQNYRICIKIKSNIYIYIYIYSMVAILRPLVSCRLYMTKPVVADKHLCYLTYIKTNIYLLSYYIIALTQILSTLQIILHLVSQASNPPTEIVITISCCNIYIYIYIYNDDK